MTNDETTEALRRMVREVLQEVLPRERSQSSAAPAPRPAPPTTTTTDVRRVRVSDDHDLADLVTQVLNLAEDPRRVADLRHGRIRFLLADDPRTVASTAPGPIDVERGAVTERLIQRAAREQRALRIGSRAVITPLARDRARALGVALDRITSSPDPSSAYRKETR
jgi:hypothetical protein